MNLIKMVNYTQYKYSNDVSDPSWLTNFGYNDIITCQINFDVFTRIHRGLYIGKPLRLITYNPSKYLMTVYSPIY